MIRSRERGAVLVEAIVVIAFLILAFTGFVYFHALYTSKLHTSRAARAAALHHAIIGCQGSTAGELALVGGASTKAGGYLANDPPYANGAGSNLSGVAQQAVGGSSGVSSLGAKIVHVTDDGTAGAHGGTSTFRSDTSTTSWVGCADPVTDEQLLDILPKVRGAIPF